jgi:hypothetical protein
MPEENDRSLRVFNSIIQIDHLTDQQQWLCQQLWLCETFDEIIELRDAIDRDMHHDLMLMILLIKLADLDNSVVDESDCIDAQVEIMNLMRQDQ